MKKGRLQKLMSLLLCAMMVVAVNAQALPFAMTAAAATPAGLSVDNATPTVGGTFTVTASLPALADQFDTLDLKVWFDPTFVQATAVTVTSIPGTSGMYSNASEANANGFFSASYYSSSGDPIDFPGVTLAATFTVKDGAPLDTEVLFTADAVNFYVSYFDYGAFDYVDITPAGAVRSVKVTVSEAVGKKAYIDTASLSLADTIDVNFYTILTNAVTADAGAYALFTGPNGEKQVLVSEATVTGDGRCVFAYPVFAKQTLEEITIRFFDGDGAQIDLFMNDAAHTAIGTEGYSYSVGEYLTAIGESEEGAEMKNLAAALTDYGAAADILFGHNTENPPTVQADLSAITADSTVSYKIIETGSEPSGFSLIGATLLLENETTLRIYFTSEGAPAFSVTVDGETATPVEKDGAYYVSIPGITAKELGTVHQICFGDYQINCSALTYAYSVLKYYPESVTSEQAVNLRTLARTLVRYYDTAVAYFESK
ncbi:MAG: hypothetical protein IJR89_00050 [Clostridia bacterium]|nr:hypothetical protein [Clostridia bacterium]